MNQILQLLSIAFLLSSCTEKSKLEGIWVESYSVNGSEKEGLFGNLWEFKGDTLFKIKIRDATALNQDIVTMDTTKFRFSNGNLELDTFSVKTQLAKDYLTLEYDYSNLVLRRIPEEYKELDISADCFKNSFIIQSKNYQDTISFINDSLLFYTGTNRLNFPGRKWGVFEYKGFKFLNIHDHLEPVLLITSCSSSGIDLKYISDEVIEVKFKPTKGQTDRNQLIGKWKEDFSVHPPPPIGAIGDNLKFSIEFNADSIKIEEYGRVNTYKWDLTSDGKRIYFIDKFTEEDNSWKLLDISDSTLTIRTIGRPWLRDEIVKYDKEKTAVNIETDKQN